MMRVQTQRQNTRAVSVGAPTRGLVAIDTYSGDPAMSSALWLYNLLPTEYGLRVRPGTKEFATNIPSSLSGQVRSILSWASAHGTTDKIFACTDLGIYDISDGGEGPHPQGLAWPSPGGKAGWCSSLNYTNVNGDHFLLVCDEENGYYIYDGTDWTQGTFTGSPKPEPEDLVHITEWNGRIWFVERDSTTAWYLDPLALTGSITPMDVGNRFKGGGSLAQNAAWSIDDGAGMDDKFVQISSEGDVLVWHGINPDDPASLALVGRWQVGFIPPGRRVLSDWGGDVVIISYRGVTKLSALITSEQPTLDSKTQVTNNIHRYFRSEMAKVGNDFGWSAEIIPGINAAAFTVPRVFGASSAPIQFVLNINTHAWCMFRNLDMVCLDRNSRGVFFGTSDNRVIRFEGSVDDVPLDGSESKAISFSMLTQYSNLGSPGTWKRPQFVRPSWVGSSNPIYDLQIRYDFDLAEINVSPPFLGYDSSKWDQALWDEDTWAGSAQSYLETVGVNGMGRFIALAIRGTAASDLSYLGADIMLDSGGLL